MSDELKKVRKEIEGLNKKISDITADIDRMEKKRASVAGLISNLEASLKSAQEAHQEAIRSFARDKISEADLNRASKTISDLEATLSRQQAVITVVNGDILGRKNEHAEIYKLLQRREENAWSLIADAEVAKLAEPLRRAFAARRKSSPTTGPRDFGEQIIKKHLLIGNETFDSAAEGLAREYLR